MKINIEKFKKQIQYLIDNGYKTYRFDDLNDLNLKFDKKSVLIAFDDGHRSNLHEIFEFMKSKGIKYNIFLAINEISSNPAFLSWDEVRKMHEEGLVGFGAHTFNHVDCSDLSKIDPSVEFQKADEVFEKELGYKPLDFCYPYGRYSTETNNYLRENSSYKRIYTSDMRYSYPIKDKIIFGRNGISDNDSFGVFKNKLKGNYNVFSYIFERLNG